VGASPLYPSYGNGLKDLELGDVPGRASMRREIQRRKNIPPPIQQPDDYAYVKEYKEALERQIESVVWPVPNLDDDAVRKSVLQESDDDDEGKRRDRIRDYINLHCPSDNSEVESESPNYEDRRTRTRLQLEVRRHSYS
jgi:hypothetical protein